MKRSNPLVDSVALPQMVRNKSLEPISAAQLQR